MGKILAALLMLAGGGLALLSVLMMIGWAGSAERSLRWLAAMAVLLAVAAALMLAGRGLLRRSAIAAAAPAAPAAAPVADAPRKTTPPRHLSGDARKLSEALLELNKSDAPFRIVDGSAEGADLIAEWKLVDARWRDLAMNAKVERVFRIFLKLDSQRRAVRAVDRAYSVEWSAGVPTLAPLAPGAAGSAEFFRGQQHSKEFAVAYRYEDLFACLGNLLRGRWVPPKPVYAYRFDTGDIKRPIEKTVARLGWTYEAAAFTKL